jgi:hypothetical protein
MIARSRCQTALSDVQLPGRPGCRLSRRCCRSLRGDMSAGCRRHCKNSALRRSSSRRSTGSARPAQVFAPDTCKRHEWLTGCPLAHPAVANARVLRRREQLIAHSSALTTTSPLGRVFLDDGHVVFPAFKSIQMKKSDGGRSDHHVNDAFSRIGASPSRRRQPHRLMQRLRVRSIHGLVCCSGVGRATHCCAEVAVFGRSAAAGTT